MKVLKIRFNNLTLYKKILLIISVTLICTYFVFFLSIHILTGRYEKELYQANAQALNHVSSSMASELQAIETISNSLISDPVIQNNLCFLKDNPGSNRGALARRDIYQGLYPYTFYDNYIKLYI